MIRYLDVCSGYSAFTLATEGLGFECAGYAEIDAFPSAMLGRHYGASRPRYMPDPDADGIEDKERNTRLAMRKSMATLSDSHFGNAVTNFGDFTQIREDDVGPVDLLIGGTPCQAFSQAGKRLGLDDPRGNLTLEFLALAKRVRAKWLAWENVAGFLSHDDGRTMGTFLGLLGELGYGWAYRLLDAQFIRVDGAERAVPQRRKRIILVGHLGDAAGPASVLFERESLRGNPAPRRQSRKGVAPTISARTQGGGGHGTDFDLNGGLIAAEIAGTMPAGSNATGGDRPPGMSQESADSYLVAQAFGGGNTSGPIDVATTTTTTTTTQRIDFDSETFVVGAVPDIAGAISKETFTGAAGGRPDSATQGHFLPVAPEIASSLTRGAESSGKGGYAGRRQEDDTNLVAHAFDARQRDVCPYGDIAPPLDTDGFSVGIAHSLRADGFDAREEGTGRGTPIVPVEEPMVLMERGRGNGSNLEYRSDGTANALLTPNGGRGGMGVGAIQHGWAVRRLTPTECERLMDVPDGFTAIQYRGKPAADGPRYKALGNSQTRNMMRWVAHGLRDVIDAQRREAGED